MFRQDARRLAGGPDRYFYQPLHGINLATLPSRDLVERGEINRRRSSG